VKESLLYYKKPGIANAQERLLTFYFFWFLCIIKLNEICTGVQNAKQILDKNKKEIHGSEAEHEDIDFLFGRPAYIGSFKYLDLSECL